MGVRGLLRSLEMGLTEPDGEPLDGLCVGPFGARRTMQVLARERPWLGGRGFIGPCCGLRISALPNGGSGLK